MNRRFATHVGSLFLLAIFALPVAAQRAGNSPSDQQQGAAAAPGTSKVIPTIRTVVYDRLNEAQICMDEGDLPCALEVIERVQQMRDLNNYEMAQTYNFRAFLAFEEDDFPAAVRAYEQILSVPFEDMPDGLIQSSMRNLATLYIQLEDYEQGLTTYLQWMDLPFTTPTADDYYLLASIHYQMDSYADGIAPLEMAIQLANEAGEIGDENWYQLLYVFNFQLEDTDEVIRLLTFMVENWTKRDWVLALAGQMSSLGREEETLALFEAAYEAGWLTRGTELVQLANLYLNARTPYKAAAILDRGLSDGTIESTQSNWRTLAQAWQLSAEHERAVPALERASDLSDDGEIDRLLAQSLARLARWEDCADAARSSLDRGGLDREDYVYLQLGQCLVNMKQFSEARTAFQGAARDDRSERDALRWIQFVDTEIQRDRANREALASLQ
jgi:tetratricopeptide (TPR) repeat protein